MRSIAFRQKESRLYAQALVEFAFTFPVFMLLLVGLIDTSRMLFTYASLANAVREMARVVAISGNGDAEVLDAFNNYALILGPVRSADRVCVYVADLSAAASGVTVPTTCTSSGWWSCPLPNVLAGSCSTALPSRMGMSEGYVVVHASHEFEFNPVFGGVAALAQGALGLPKFALATTTRAHLE